jgi:hypothetical protein
VKDKDVSGSARSSRSRRTSNGDFAVIIEKRGQVVAGRPVIAPSAKMAKAAAQPSPAATSRPKNDNK